MKTQKLIVIVAIICLLVGPNVASGAPGDKVRVFVTSGTFNGDLGGLAGADTICTNAALATGVLAGTWTAWLSDGTTDARDRIPDAEYVRLDDVVVANDLADLTDGTLDAEINLDEFATDRSFSNTWTGTLTDGTGTDPDCSDWTDGTNGSHATQGDTDDVNSRWTELTSTAFCDLVRRLYCFSEVPFATNERPVANANGRYNADAGVDIIFDGSGSYDADGTIASWEWDFGDGTPAGNGETVTHSYNSDGIYIVKLTVTDDDGDKDIDHTAAVIVSAVVQPEDPVADANGPYTAFDHVQVFVTSGTFNGDFVNLAGADTECTNAALATGVLAGTWTAWLSDSATDAFDRILDARYQLLDGTRIANDLSDLADGTLDAPINLDEFATDASGGNPWTGTFPDGTGTADTCSDWTDDTAGSNGTQGDTDDTNSRWTQHGNIIDCDFIRQLYCFDDAPVLAVNTAVTFDGSGSRDADGNILSWVWDFGDGTPTGNGETVQHTYAANGLYFVTLTVGDDNGNTDTDGTVAVIGSGLLPPVADSGGPYNGKKGKPVTFDGSGSTDLDGDIERYQWDFGDGNTGSGEITTHSYSAPGIYNVTLTVTDDNDGTEDSDSTEADVTSGGGGSSSGTCFINTIMGQ